MQYLFIIVALFILACGDPDSSTPTETNETPKKVLFSPPKGFPDLRVPDENPVSEEKWELGKFLFYDTRLSGNETQSCGSCHFQEHAFADPEPLSEGSTGDHTPRNAPSLSNVGYNATLTWAHPNLLTIEQQIPIPMFGEDPVELGITNKGVILKRFEQVAYYRTQFAKAFPKSKTPLNFQNLIFAIATFTRSLISGNSPYDRLTYYKEEDALSDSAKRGGKLFFSEELECHHCHGGFNFTQSVAHNGTVFEEKPFHNTGQFNIGGKGDYPTKNQGIFLFSGVLEDMGKFRAPTLRNIAESAPYMHDGKIKTLEDVIRIYERGGRLTETGPNTGDGSKNPFKSGLVSGFKISDQDRKDLVAFLKSLSDKDFLNDPRFSDPFKGLKKGESPFPSN